MKFAFSVALFGLSIVTGMLGTGLGIAAVPVLSMGLDDLMNQADPLSLLLNGAFLLTMIGTDGARALRMHV